MTSPFYLTIKGKFVIAGKEPDGDSVRFIADDPELYQELQRNYRIKPSRDRSVQLRFEGIDAPEVHYGRYAQPLGDETRDFLLKKMGFAKIEFQGDRVQSADPDTISGVILTQAADVNGRPISYALIGKNAAKLENGDWTQVEPELLRQTLNFLMMAEGRAYYTVYTSTPRSHRQVLREAALAAREKDLGVWAADSTSIFRLVDFDSITPPNGQLILPKLFRRCTDYLKAVADGYSGNLADWLEGVSLQRSRNENDAVIIRDRTQVSLSSLIEQYNSQIAFQEDLLDITFVEKT
ncbi:nuclease [Chroococcidiopsis sp. CCALA 051]|uniref:thermonuclease family protein n=1 Tax=Chroococcidiopsis sp. CCALA 051 TaxID=869949 RepID=UPI000D0E0CDF|nr:thermonuclease family protein [Chroococcidiopsis sp. CCALA 051]PSM49692.1 nuclease [Chroococcidiopsis sp. CCALA 051]